MRTIVIVGSAALLGALGVLAVQRFGGGPEGATDLDSPQGATRSDAALLGTEAGGVDGTRPEPAGGELQEGPARSAPPLPTLVGGPRFNPGKDADLPGAAREPAESARPLLAHGEVREASSPAFEEERRVALATFDQGDRRLGAQLLEGIYAEGRDQTEIDLSAEVARLLVAEESFVERLEYAGYLARNRRRAGSPVDRLVSEQIERARGLLGGVEDRPDTARSVWEELTVAHALAVDPAQRQAVLAILEPFLERMIFSGRYTPLLTSHTVVVGESLDRLARRYGTTVSAMKRLNKLTNDTIQPRQRLRILEGTVRVQVDKNDFCLQVTVDHRLLFDRPVGLGKDNATPVGTFTIGVRQENPTWWRPGEPPLPPGDPRNILGTRWLGFRDTEELAGFGIHGTADAQSIGKESSAGCVRLRNEDIELLYDFIPPGTEVVIRP